MPKLRDRLKELLLISKLLVKKSIQELKQIDPIIPCTILPFSLLILVVSSENEYARVQK